MGKAKVKKTINKAKRRQARADVATKKQLAMGVQVLESKKARRKRIAMVTLAHKSAVGAASNEEPEVLRQRQATEWKEMKAKVALLKKERHHLPKKGGKSLKQTAAQQIRRLI